MTVGERIKRTRLELGMSQEELAKRMNYSGKSSVCKAETYGDNITTAKVQRFADALGVSFDYLMGWEEKHPEIATGQADARILAKIHLLNDANRSVLMATLDALLESQKEA